MRLQLLLVAALAAGCATDTEKLVGMSTIIVAGMTVASAANVWGCTPETCAATPREQSVVFGAITGALAIGWAVVTATHYDPIKL